MPGCAAVYCSNSAKKGFLMKKFPKDPGRRKLWVLKMKREKWVPTDYSCLCEVHFAPEMWEKTRVDGSRKLKHTAVPTIFCYSSPTEIRKGPEIGPDLALQMGETQDPLQVQPHPLTCESEVIIETPPPTSRTTSYDETQATSTISSQAEVVVGIEEHDTSVTEGDLVKVNIALCEELQKYKQMYFKQRVKTLRLRRQLRNTLIKLKKQTEKEQKIEQTVLLKQLFNNLEIKRGNGYDKLLTIH